DLASSFSFGPPPGWVEPFGIEDLISRNRETGLANLLFQLETRIATRETFIRSVYRIESAEALNQNANIEFDLEASCQSLTVHNIRVVREGRVVYEAQEDEFRFIQPEEARNRLVFDGTYRAIHLIGD